MEFWLYIICFVAGTVCGFTIAAMCQAAKDDHIPTTTTVAHCERSYEEQVKEGVTESGVKYRYNPGTRKVDRT